MRERLSSIIGKDAYKVAIHTFHSFGSEIINQNGDYFYHGAHFRPADELSSHEIIRTILDELDYTNPLASKMNGEYTYIRDVLASVSELKRSGLTSDELLQILDANDAILDAIEPHFQSIFSNRIGSTTLAQLVPLSKEVAELTPLPLPPTITPLSNTLALSLAHAIDEATALNSTKPITAWKNRWFTKNKENQPIFKARASAEKLRALSFVYFQYLARMQEAQLYDYDDMILRVVHALEIFDDLRYNLQEKYQYIMVDEFQDTNGAQMRILESLTNNPAQGDTPNILVVGDDDQAIYSFQGADISNILSFRQRYSKVAAITLTDNYRSTEPILTAAREIIVQGGDRLEHYLEGVNKTLTAHKKNNDTSVNLYAAPTLSTEASWLVSEVQRQIKQGTEPHEIAVLARRHHEITRLLPYFAAAGISVEYDRRDNVLELDPIILLERLARVVTLLASQRHFDADAMLPELLAHPAWGISPESLWRLSIKAYDARARWLDTMETLPEFATLWQWIIETVAVSLTEPLEPILDRLMGVPDQESDSFVSPLYEYFFGNDRLADDADRYLTYLEGVRTIRTHLREHQNSTERATLQTFVDFITLSRQAGSTITSVRKASEASSAVRLMTAHASKGLEFDTVFITGAVEQAWGEKVRGRSRMISYPENLQLSPAGDSPDERLRLFFVAATRAKRQLFISYSSTNDTGKPLDRAGFLLPLGEAHHIDEPDTIETVIQDIQQQWYSGVATPNTALKELLASTLDRYKLSATHLGNFLDVTRGGPQLFLIHNLLRFPKSMSPAAAYGSAIHATLQRAHAHLSATKKYRAFEDILNDFESELATYRLSEKDANDLLQKGIHTLQSFLDETYQTFTPEQKVELNFSGQQSIVDGAHLTGSLDLVDIDTAAKTIQVTDYKTGHPSNTWKGTTDYEKLKLHRYRQQLMFYKILVEHSRDFNTYTVNRGVLQFVEPTATGQILALDDDFSNAELDEFKKLVAAVYARITSLDLPSTDEFEPTYKGVLAFEKFLIDNN
jgi:DNA helicase-2/ATP-dependent DNA helicase PcrA